MHIFRSTLFRALCAIAIGYMLIEYPEDMRYGFIMAIGALFLTSGAIAWAGYFFSKRKAAELDIYDAQGNRLSPSTPFFPVAGTGSAILGLALIVMPGILEDVLNVILGLMLMIGAFNQYVTLFQTRKYARIPVFYWVSASLLFLLGLGIILKPTFVSETLSFFMQLCGWCFIAYAVLEVVIATQAALFRRQFVKTNQAMMERKAEQENASLIEDMEIQESVKPLEDKPVKD